MNANISDIFYSIQGEGLYLGCPQIFIRFFGCHFGCAICDTPQGKNAGSRISHLSSATLLKKVLRLPLAHSVSLTGGEPLEQKDFLKEFLPLLRTAKMPIHLETNGTLPLALKEVIGLVDVIAMDIKLPSTMQTQPCWKAHEQFLRIANTKEVFVKVVVGPQTRLREIIRAATLASRVNRDIVFILQPQQGCLCASVVHRCLAAQRKILSLLPQTRIIAQMHPFLRVP